MKKYIIMFVFISSGMCLAAQTGCCPYIDSIYTIPWNPIFTDNIKIVTKTTTPNLGMKLYYSVSKKEDTFMIKGCFWGGVLTQLKRFFDTTYIGYLLPGTYTIKYKCLESYLTSSCTPDDSAYMSVSFKVRFNNNNNAGLNQVSESGFNIYPNPTNGLINFVLPNSISYATIEVYNTLGALVDKQTIFNNQSAINLSNHANGLYIVKVIGLNGVISIQKIIKE